MKSPRDQYSLSSSEGAQTINQYPTAFREWVSLKEEDLIGLFAFPLPIHLALCKFSERWMVGSSTSIMLQYWTAAMPVLRQLPDRALPTFPWGPELWTRSHLLPMATQCDLKCLAGWQGTGKLFLDKQSGTGHPHNDSCSVNRTVAAARCSWRWTLDVPGSLAPVGVVRTPTCSRRCLFYHYCTKKLFMGLNLHVLTELFLPVCL